MGSAAERLERWLAGLGRRGVPLVLLVLTLAALAPGFATLPPVDRDEARFAQATRQMLASGDFIDIRFQDGPRYKKPVGIYWLQSAAVALTGQPEGAPIWRYRLPSALALLVAVLATARAAALFGGRQPGLFAGLMLGGAVLAGFEARLATTDAALLACVALAGGVLARLYRDATAVAFSPGAGLRPARVALFWGALAVSVLVKGPIGPLVIGGAVAGLAAWHRRAGWLGALRPGWGLLALVLVVAPWYLAITLKAGGAFWAEALGRDLLGKVAEAQESHGAPPGSYLAALWLTFFPGSVMLAVSLPALWRARRAAWLALVLVWVLPLWLVLEASPTKLPHYVLPLYPALALALAQVWADVVQGGLRGWQWVLGGGLGLIAPLGLAATGVFAARYGALPWAPLAAGGTVVALGAALAVAAVRRRLAGVVLVGLWAMGVGLVGGAVATLARVPALWPAQAVAGLAAATDCPAPVIFAARYAEPSLVFLSPGEVRFVTAPEAAAALASDPCALALVPLSEAVAGARLLGEVRGVNLGNGAPLALGLYAR